MEAADNRYTLLADLDFSGPTPQEFAFIPLSSSSIEVLPSCHDRHGLHVSTYTQHVRTHWTTWKLFFSLSRSHAGVLARV